MGNGSDEMVKLSDVKRLQLGPGDTLVLFSERTLSDEVYFVAEQKLKSLFPNNQIIILDGGLDVAVITQAGGTCEPAL